MQQLAIVNGFTLAKTEQRCGVCGAAGHLGFECPETDQRNYKMANVTCSICGDKGHATSDCKQAAAKHQRENVDWKAEAERKRSMDAEYTKMMGELGELGLCSSADTPNPPPHQAHLQPQLQALTPPGIAWTLTGRNESAIYPTFVNTTTVCGTSALGCFNTKNANTIIFAVPSCCAPVSGCDAVVYARSCIHTPNASKIVFISIA